MSASLNAPPGTRRGPAPVTTRTAGPTVENAAATKLQSLAADGATPLDMPSVKPLHDFARAATDAAARKRSRLIDQLERAVRDRRLVGDHDAARLAAAWLADLRGAA